MLLFIYSSGHSQSVCLGQDTAVCEGSYVGIQNCYGTSGGLTGGIYLNSPGIVTLTDDIWSGVIPIGFPFSFYNSTYNQCIIGSNGLISFDLAKANEYCSWSFVGIGPLPNSTLTDARNAAMICYQDMNPALGGQILYQTIGSTPNRKFVVLYKDIQTFSCAQCSYTSLILYETTNVIEFHIGNKPPCPTWNSGLAIQGLENATSSTAHITPGRNIAQWSANQECKRFTPISPTNTSSYVISNGVYTIVGTSNFSVMWGNTLGQTFPYNNGILNIASVPSGSTGYFLTGTACNVGIGVVSDTTWITGKSSKVLISSTTDICLSGTGTATATAAGGSAPFYFQWNTGATGNFIDHLSSGIYTVTLTDGAGCKSSAETNITNTSGLYTATSTPVSCPGGTDGSATVQMTPVLGNLTYHWNDPMGQISSTASNLSAGSYQCIVNSDIGCSGSINVTVSEIPAMEINILTLQNVTCNSGNDGSATIGVTSGTGTSPYIYDWTPYSSSSPNISGLSAGSYTTSVTDANNCSTSYTVIITEPSPLHLNYITNPIRICPESSVLLEAQGSGGSSTYNYTWYENGTIIGNGTSITVDPDFTNTTYCLQLSENCGSPVADTCINITFPTPINPKIEPDKQISCIPAEFTFINTSDNAGEIDSVFYHFSDQNTFLVQGSKSFTNTFFESGYYSCQINTISVYGCIYSETIQNLIEVKPLPSAQFTITDNPSYFTETTVGMIDQSTGGASNWYWESPGSSPIMSTEQYPSFTFPQGEIGQYPVTLIVYTDFGCSDTVVHDVNIVPEESLFASNTFTPNGDELNQEWKYYISGIDVFDFVISIFNRWGEIVWEAHDPSMSWDGNSNGQPVPSGTYSWRAKTKSLYSGIRSEYSGFINLIR
jgi:gliding motility-associated-like protein